MQYQVCLEGNNEPLGFAQLNSVSLQVRDDAGGTRGRWQAHFLPCHEGEHGHMQGRERPGYTVHRDRLGPPRSSLGIRLELPGDYVAVSQFCFSHLLTNSWGVIGLQFSVAGQNIEVELPV